MSNMNATLPGQETLLACWNALAQESPGASLIRSSEAAAAVFPSWAPLNNAVVLNVHDGAVPAVVTARLTSIYSEARVPAWALWIPSCATDWEAPDTVRVIDGMQRDTTTVVMHATVPRDMPLHDGVVRGSLAAVTRLAKDQPIPIADLEPETGPAELTVWVIEQDHLAVACAYTFLHKQDCGIYSVGTLPAWRRRGLARRLMEHLLADAHRRGARTATLQSTQLGQRLYESLGFEAKGRYEEWVPL